MLKKHKVVAYNSDVGCFHLKNENSMNLVWILKNNFLSSPPPSPPPELTSLHYMEVTLIIVAFISTQVRLC